MWDECPKREGAIGLRHGWLVLIIVREKINSWRRDCYEGAGRVRRGRGKSSITIVQKGVCWSLGVVNGETGWGVAGCWLWRQESLGRQVKHLGKVGNWVAPKTGAVQWTEEWEEDRDEMLTGLVTSNDSLRFSNRCWLRFVSCPKRVTHSSLGPQSGCIIPCYDRATQALCSVPIVLYYNRARAEHRTIYHNRHWAYRPDAELHTMAGLHFLSIPHMSSCAVTMLQMHFLVPHLA